ncbi:hypothetical protein [Acrocarpospora sp. B8E8]|uniref:hypothetical protein n=1 Tax=Acrocarpospora sp. B8E8 TaxID=3153572 RepID=UPI00325E6292
MMPDTANTGVAGLAERAATAARRHRDHDAAAFAARHRDWPEWARRAAAARALAITLGVGAEDVTVTEDPDRRYADGRYPGMVLTVTEPVTERAWRFIPDLTLAPGTGWLLLGQCPGCGEAVPMAAITALADLGEYLAPDPEVDTEIDTTSDIAFDNVPGDHFGDPAHRPGCAHAALT